MRIYIYSFRAAASIKDNGPLARVILINRRFTCTVNIFNRQRQWYKHTNKYTKVLIFHFPFFFFFFFYIGPRRRRILDCQEFLRILSNSME